MEDGHIGGVLRLAPLVRIQHTQQTRFTDIVFFVRKRATMTNNTLVNDEAGDDEPIDPALRHVAQIIERAKRMRVLAEEMIQSAQETTLRSGRLRRDAVKQYHRLNRTEEKIKAQVDNTSTDEANEVG